MALTEHRPWWHVSKRLPRNPFDPVEVIQHLQWCCFCKMDVDVDVEAANMDGVDAYRKRCKRCGEVIQWGLGRRAMTQEKSFPEKVIRFIKESGNDRR